MQNILRVHRGVIKLGAGLKRQTTFKHGDVIAAVGAGKIQLSLACRLEGMNRVRLPAIIGLFHTLGKNAKALQHSLRNQIIAALKMAIDGCCCYPSIFHRLRWGKAGWAVCLDQQKRGIHQSLA